MFRKILCGVACLFGFVTAPTFAGPNQHYVDKLYHDLLGRSIDGGGQSLAAQLDAVSITRSAIAGQILASPEYLGTRVDSYYQDYLNRTPSAQERSLGMSAITTQTLEDYQANGILGGNEYFTSRAGNDNANFVQAIFTDLLDRNPTPGELSTFQAQLNASLSRAALASLVLHSVEYDHDLIDAWYQQFLSRAPDAGSLSFFTGQLQSAIPDQNLVQQIVSSDEYYADALPEPACVAPAGLLLLFLSRRHNSQIR